MTNIERDAQSERLETIATKITQGIYSAPLAQATERQRILALTVASNVAAALPTEASMAIENKRLRAGLIEIQKACIAGKICDDVPWFDSITTLHDYIDEVLSPSLPAAVADLFEATAA